MSQPRRPSPSSGEVVAVLCAFAVLGALPATGQVRVSTIQEAVDRWAPETHLYVMGDVGLRDAQLAELEGWLEERHWTVLLVEDAEGQQFKDPEGMLRDGKDAIEWGTGQGIARLPRFAAQVHPATGEPDGAILSIVLAQRALYYTGSQAQDSRGLGEKAFRGNLDQWAIAALRNNGDVESAVKETVTRIDAGLTQAIGWEVARQREQAASHLAWVRTRISATETEIARLEETAAALRAAPPYPKEGAARPDTASLRQRIGRANALLGEEKSDEALAVVEGVFQEVQLSQSNIDLYRSYTDRLAACQHRLDRLRSRMLGAAARERLRNASRVLAAARDRHRRVDLGSDFVNEAEAAIWDAELAAGRFRAETILFSILGLWLVGILAWLTRKLNRRRLPLKQEAEALLASWQTALEELAVLFGELEQRVSRLAGLGSGDEWRFAGTTLELARQARSDVGSLAMLRSSAGAVLEQALERIRPRQPGAALYNLFFPGNYRKGLALLRDEPGPIEELTVEIDSRAAGAAGALDELEAALGGLPDLLKTAHERIWQAEFQKDFLVEAAAGDGLFLVPALFSEVLPAATQALDEAQETADSDPVGTFRGSAARAGRLAADAWRLSGLCRSARSGVMPALESSETRLQDAGFPTTWVGEKLQSLSARAAELATRVAAEEESAEIETLAVDVAALQTRAEQAVELSGRLAETRARIAAEEARVEASRREMGTALGLAPELLLREKGADPSERLAAGTEEAGEAGERIGRGEVDEAEAALERANWQATEAAAIVDASLRTFAARESAVEELRAETERIAALVPAHEMVLAGTREAFAESALALGPGDEVHSGADGTVGDNADEAREEVAAARRRLGEAAAQILAGRMLAAASGLRQVRAHQEQARFRLAEVTAKRARLDRAREDNRALLGGMEVQVTEMEQDLSSDRRITRPTLAVFEEAAEKVRTARERVDSGREDPLRTGQELLTAREALDRVEETLVPADRRLHGQAASALEQAREAVEEAGSWSSDYDVPVPGQPGVNSLAEAENHFRQGRYAEARHAADAARETAQAALEEVRAEERRRRDAARGEEWRRREESLRSWSSSDNDDSSYSRRDSGSSGSSSFASGSSSNSGSSGWSGGSSGSGSSGSGSSSWSGGSSSGSGKSGW